MGTDPEGLLVTGSLARKESIRCGRFACFAWLATALLSLAACGGQSSSDPTPQPATPPTTSPSSNQATNPSTPSTSPTPQPSAAPTASPDQARRDKLAKFAAIRDEFQSVIAGFDLWTAEVANQHAKLTQEAEAKITAADLDLKAAREAEAAAKAALDPVVRQAAAATDTLKLAKTAIARPHFTFIAVTDAHLERVGNFEALGKAQADAMDEVEVYYDKAARVRDEWEAFVTGITAEARETTPEEDEKLAEFEKKLEAANAEYTAKVTAYEQAAKAIEDWKLEVDKWMDIPVPTPPGQEDAAKKARTATAAHRTSVTAFLTVRAKWADTTRSVERASVAVDAADAKYREASKASREAARAYRSANTKFEQVRDYVQGQEQARAMGARVQPDYAALEAARQTRNAALTAANEAETVSKRAKTALATAQKNKRTHVTALKSLDKQLASERLKIESTAKSMRESMTPWANEFKAALTAEVMAEEDLADLVKRRDQLLLDLTVAGEKVRHCEGLLRQAQETAAAIGPPATPPSSAELHRALAAMSRLASSDLSKDAVMAFRLLRFDFPEWPDAKLAKDAYERFWSLAVAVAE